MAKKRARRRVDAAAERLYNSMDIAFLIGMHVAFTMDKAAAVERGAPRRDLLFIDDRLKLIATVMARRPDVDPSVVRSATAIGTSIGKRPTKKKRGTDGR